MFSRMRGYQIHKPLEILFYVYVKTPPGSPAPPLPGAKSDSKNAVITPCHKPTFLRLPYMGQGICLNFWKSCYCPTVGLKKVCKCPTPGNYYTRLCLGVGDPAIVEHCLEARGIF